MHLQEARHDVFCKGGHDSCALRLAPRRLAMTNGTNTLTFDPLKPHEERPPALNHSMMKNLAHRINVTLKLKSFNDEKTCARR